MFPRQLFTNEPGSSEYLDGIDNPPSQVELMRYLELMELQNILIANWIEFASQNNFRPITINFINGMRNHERITYQYFTTQEDRERAIDIEQDTNPRRFSSDIPIGVVLFGESADGSLVQSEVELREDDEKEYQDENAIIYITSPERFFTLINSIVIELERLNTEGNRWTYGLILERIWVNATAKDMYEPEQYLERILYQLKTEKQIDLIKNWTRVGSSQRLSGDFYIKHNTRSRDYESHNDIDIAFHSTEDNDSEKPNGSEDIGQQISTVRYGWTGDEEVTIYAVQAPSFEGLTPDYIMRKLYSLTVPDEWAGGSGYLLTLIQLAKGEYFEDIFQKLFPDFPVTVNELGTKDTDEIIAVIDRIHDYLIRYGHSEEEAISYFERNGHTLDESDVSVIQMVYGLFSKGIYELCQKSKIVLEIDNERSETMRMTNKLLENKYRKVEMIDGTKESIKTPKAKLTSLLVALELFRKQGVNIARFPMFLPMREHIVNRTTREIDFSERMIDYQMHTQLMSLLLMVSEITGWRISEDFESIDSGSYIVLEYDENWTPSEDNSPEFIRELTEFAI